jgi:hypothetical protein
LALAAAVCVAAGCEFVRETTSPTTPSPPPPPAGGNSTMMGTWQSQTSTPLVDSSTCGQFKWVITSQTPTSIAGTFTAICLGNVPFSGSGVGELTANNQVKITVTGSANIQGVTCNANITATATIEGDLVTIPYSGQTCLGPISGVEYLRKPSPPSPSPPPPPPPPPPPSQPPSVACISNNPQFIIDCISDTYPERRVPGVTVDQRRENMAWLRDRIIEAGKCGGLDLGWNLKRGGPEISIDFLTQKLPGDLLGIDIGAAYDDVTIELQLQWVISTFPFYLEYPMPNCS